MRASFIKPRVLYARLLLNCAFHMRLSFIKLRIKSRMPYARSCHRTCQDAVNPVRSCDITSGEYKRVNMNRAEHEILAAFDCSPKTVFALGELGEPSAIR